MRASVVLALLPSALATPWAKRSEPAPVLRTRIDESLLVADKYIVKFKDDISAAIVDDAATIILSSTPDHIFTAVFNGFVATLDHDTLRALRDHPDVDYIEQDATVEANAFVTQANAPWGLAHISKHAGTSTSYVYDDSAGEGTCSYIVDSGIDTTHPDFSGRATNLANFIDNSDADATGHGTHVAGTVGSTTYGVAKKTTIYGVKVLGTGGTGTVSSVIAGLDFVVTDSATRNCPKGAFANMSIGVSGGISSVVDQAVQAVVAANVFLAVSAGNDDADVYWHSPAHVANICTVAAVDSNNRRADWSNYGGGVDVLAPGVNITSLAIGGGTRLASGTSMASPHVAGLAAYLAALEGNPGPVALCSRIAQLSTKNVVTNLPQEAIPSLNTPNRLAFNGNPSALGISP